MHDEPGSVFTRADWFCTADRLLDALTPFRSDSGALIDLPGRPSWSGRRSDAHEGYARSFLLVAFRVAGSAGEDPLGLLPRYRDGLLAGTDPAHADAWPTIVDRSQALVEAASIVIGLHFTRPWLWDRLEPAEQERVAAWLAPSAHVATGDNNWVLFRVVVQEFLAGSGFPFDPAVIDTGLDRLDDWYEGEGWYRDGDGQNFDYYNAWAMHLYPHVWAGMHERRDPVRAADARARYLERLAAFLPQHVRSFGADGTPVFQGRSLAYRFAALAPVWLGELGGVSPLEPGATRRLASRALRRFTDGGALDDQGLLTNGWLGAFPPMVQAYSGPASPYWASKGFLGLLLPADSPVWGAPESAAPVEREDATLTLAAPGFLLQSTRADGIARLVNHGSDHHPPLVGTDDPHYGRLAYSSATAPSFDDHPVDNHVAVLDERGRASRRGAIERLPGGEHVLASAHLPFWADPGADTPEPVPGVRIATASTTHGATVVHAHVVASDSATRLPLRFGGFAIAATTAPAAITADPRASVVGDGVVSTIEALSPGLSAGVHRATASSPLGPHTAVPVLTGTHSGPRSIHVVATVLTGAPHSPDERPIRAEVRHDDDLVRVEIVFGDGTRRVLALHG
ncbi:hypothetical protein ASE14_00245 [Agromyces sp. Root81]|uniref:DUF2264 domain-containing protein n=1 Tax=Agromyces sp. Root81 TaxID=1736601 RepID=UPI0006FC04C2|nr:DUF2264 domain-containing protein [Agromyces sp. Root81]KRC62323.1 hypothetical protein ASE14_00245 [Agromyces sp. Root81]